MASLKEIKQWLQIQHTDQLFQFSFNHHPWDQSIIYICSWLILPSLQLFNCFITYCKGILRDSLPLHYRVGLGMERVPLGAHISLGLLSRTNWSLVWGANSHERLEYLSPTVSARNHCIASLHSVFECITKSNRTRNFQKINSKDLMR